VKAVGQVTPNRYIAWYQILPLLHIPVPAGAPPFTVRCPICGVDNLSIYQDTIFGGYWHYCFECKSKGDLIELAAKTWRKSIPDTIGQLVQHDVALPAITTTPERIAIYQQSYIDEQRHAQAFWERSRRALAEHDAPGGELVRQFGIRTDLQPKLWLTQAGRFIGGTTKHKIEWFCRPHTRGSRTAACRGQRRVLRGKDWHTAMVLPFHDVPGRLSGFLFIGRDGDPEDFVFRRVGSTSLKRITTVETGLFMYEILTEPLDEVELFGNTIIVMNSPVIAARIQARHLRDHAQPLPLVSTYSTTEISSRGKDRKLVTYTTWASQPTYRYIFWNPTFSINTINTAARLGSRVLFAKRDSTYQLATPRMFLLGIKKKAEPWELVLEKELLRSSQPQRRRLFDQLDIPNSTLQHFLQQCTPELRTALQDCEKYQRTIKTAYMGHHKVVETPTGWQLKTGECVSNTIIRIDHAVQCQDDPTQSYYKGRLIQGDNQTTFVEPAARMHSQPVPLIRAHLDRAGMDVLIHNPRITKALTDIALQLRPPKTSIGVRRFGWNHQLQRFIFPQYELRPGGQVETVSALLAQDDAPCRDFEPPIDSYVRLQHLTADTNINRLFWAVAAAIGANIVGYPLNQPSTSIGLVGAGASFVGYHVAHLFGCPQSARVPDNYNHVGGFIQTLTDQHNWPIWLRFGGGDALRMLLSWQNIVSDRDIIATVPPESVHMLTMRTPWRFVVYHPTVSVPSVFLTDGRPALQQWLHDFVRRQMAPESERTVFAHRIADDMARWAERNGGNPRVIWRARTLIDEPAATTQPRALGLVTMLYRAIENGRIRVQQDQFTEHSRKPALHRITSPAPGIFIAKAVLRQVFEKSSLSPPDDEEVTQLLKDADAQNREFVYNGKKGWFVVESWWHHHLAICRQQLLSDRR